MKKNMIPTLIKYQQEILIFSLLFIIYVALLPVNGNGFDLECWSKWAEHHFKYGVQYAYDTDTDYLPVYHYVLYLFGLTQGTVNNIYGNIATLKVWTLIFDFLGVFLILKMLAQVYKDNFKEYFFFGTLMLLNLSYFYNTLFWGQVDAILSFLVFSMIYLALKEKIIGSLLLFIIVLNFKLQAIIFIPLLALVIIPALVKHFSWINLIKWLLIIIIPQIIIVFPFWYVGHLDKVWAVVNQSVGKYPIVSLNAANIWFLLLQEPEKIFDTTIFLGLTYRTWGFINFFSLSFATLFPLLKRVYEIVITKTQQIIPLNMVMLTGALITLIFFFVNTQMHERYTHPAFLFIMFFAFSTRKWWFYTLFSFAYLLSLEQVLHFFKFKFKMYNQFFFQETFIAILYLIIIVGLFFELYKGQYNKCSLTN